MKPQPQKRNQTSFAVPPGKEPKGRMMGFRPLVSIEKQIDEAVVASGKSLAEWLLEAVIAKLNEAMPQQRTEEKADNLPLVQEALRDAIAAKRAAITREKKAKHPDAGLIAQWEEECRLLESALCCQAFGRDSTAADLYRSSRFSTFLPPR